MDIDRFIAEHRATWNHVEALARRPSRLSGPEVDELVAGYQRVSAHLSTAQTSLRDPDLVRYLTGVVARARAAVYGTRPARIRSAGAFVSTTFPAAVWYLRARVAVAALFLFLPALAVGAWVATSDEALAATGPDAVRTAYVEDDFEAYYSSRPAAEFASTVFTNNARVGVMAFAIGIVFAVPTLALLAFNGANIGVAGGLFAAVGESGRFFGLIVPHGLLELTAVAVAGGAGIALGWAIIDPGDRPRRVALTEEARRAVVVVMGLVGVFLVAGLVEAFITPSSLPTPARVGVGAAIWAVFVLYVVVLGRAAVAEGHTGALGSDS